MTARTECAKVFPMKHLISGALALSFFACSGPAETSNPQDAFFEQLSTLCGQAFAGKLVSTDEADADFADVPMVMHVRTCSESEIRIPYIVGEDRSRTWVISRTEDGLRLKHDHRHEDGSKDAVTEYGGDTAGEGRAGSQAFPADEFTKAMFIAQGIPASTANTWSVDVEKDIFAYQMARPNRLFRVEFDLSAPVETPPAPWGAKTDAG